MRGERRTMNGGCQPGQFLLCLAPTTYRVSWQLQQKVHDERQRDGRPDTLLLMQHQPVYTLGRRTAAEHLRHGEPALRKYGATVEFVNRGGSVTYHGPGQLVGYPILRLTRMASGPRAYVHLLEDVIIRTLASYNIDGHRLERTPGVFVFHQGCEYKIACIGIRADHGVTLHGFSLNVDLDLRPFDLIVPCGLSGIPTTSMRHILGAPVPLRDVALRLLEHFGELFHLSWQSTRMENLDPAVGIISGPVVAEVS